MKLTRDTGNIILCYSALLGTKGLVQQEGSPSHKNSTGKRRAIATQKCGRDVIKQKGNGYGIYSEEGSCRYPQGPEPYPTISERTKRTLLGGKNELGR